MVYRLGHENSAYVARALNNAQGELHPLEVGLHPLRSGLQPKAYADRVGQQSPEASAMVGSGNGWDLVRNEPRLGQVSAGTGSKVGHPALPR